MIGHRVDAQHQIPDPEGSLRRHSVDEQTEEPVSVIMIVMMMMIMVVVRMMMLVMEFGPLGGDEWHREVEPAQMRRDGGQLELE